MSRASPERGAARRRQHAALFAALADETRLALIGELAEGEPRSISQLTDGTQLTRQAITKHLRVLERAGMVHCQRSGRERRFQFNPMPMNELRDYLARASEHWDRVLLRLKTLVEA
ncbi:MAG TPA: metalloregulator ArsR/SmtB family transcription factor [Candidatus Dormibacteraeota bacterium]|nr:metalloregulator ArsR/SmtB family transcription factor [Candidatus Dormibacteraeota bacterium]